MKKTKTKGLVLPTINLEQITDVASLFTGQPTYDEAFYDSDGWWE